MKIKPEKPKLMPVNPENIPHDLKVGKQFVVWKWELRDGKWTKPPYPVLRSSS
jgi:hypothetical protein